MWPGDRACRARCHATLAGPATIRDRFIRRQFQCGQDFCEKKPGSKLLIYEHCAFAMPTDACLRGMIAFQQRPGVDITSLLSAKTPKELVDLMELVGNYVVIIFAPCVPSDFSYCSALACRAGALRRWVGPPALKII